MAKEHIIFDKTEIIFAVLNEGQPHLENIKYSDIIFVKFKMGEKKGLFGKAGEVIEVKTKRKSVTMDQAKEKKFWDGYKAGMRKFCTDNRITLYDEVGGENIHA